MDEWDTNVEIIQETIRSIIATYASGKIELEKPRKSARAEDIMYAPSFIRGTTRAERALSDKPYTF